MPRVKRGFKARRRRNRLLKHAKGYYGARRKAFHVAIEQVHNAWEDAYRHRRTKKREYRRLWIAPHQCGGSNQRSELQSVHQWPQALQHRARP